MMFSAIFCLLNNFTIDIVKTIQVTVFMVRHKDFNPTTKLNFSKISSN